jgi:hypothetical protein
MILIKILFFIIILLIIYYINNYNIRQNFENLSDIDNKILINDNQMYNNLFNYKSTYNNLKKDILTLNKPTIDDIQVLHDKNYLNNYYYDIFGNQVQASLTDYYTNYYSTINDKKSKNCTKVNIIPKDNNFIIPDQYNNQKHMTNAYYIDYSKIIDPRTTF